MANENVTAQDQQDHDHHHHHHRSGGVASGVYGLAFLGSVIYYLQHATTFGMGVLGFLKALVWPVILVYKIMDFLKM